MQKSATLVEFDKCYEFKLQNETLAKIGFDTTENGPSKIGQHWPNGKLGKFLILSYLAKFFRG